MDATILSIDSDFGVCAAFEAAILLFCWFIRKAFATLLACREMPAILPFSHDASSKADWLDTRDGASRLAYRYL
jgi:hypothetical protein